MNEPGIDFPWLRRIKVTFEGLSGGGNAVYESDGTQETARIIARVEKTIQGIPNATNLMLYNLSENTRGSFLRGETKVKIEAGWDKGPRAELKQCFKGSLVTAFSQRAGSDIVTSINAISAIDDLNLNTINERWEAGFPVRGIVVYLANELKPGVNVDGGKIKYITGKVGDGGWQHCGTVRTALEALSKEFGFSWNIVDQNFQACKDLKSFGGDTKIKSPYLIDLNPVFSGQGMEQLVKGLRVRCTFDATVNPLFNISVESTVEKRFNSGTYIVQGVVHNLDCWNASSFITEINCTADPDSATMKTVNNLK